MILSYVAMSGARDRLSSVIAPAPAANAMNAARRYVPLRGSRSHSMTQVRPSMRQAALLIDHATVIRLKPVCTVPSADPPQRLDDFAER